MERPELMDKMVKAYKLQETLKKERQQVKLHEEEYKNLMETIVASKVQRLGKYEVSEVIGQKKRYIVSDKFRAIWPDLFNTLATVTLKDAREKIKEEDLETVCETKITMKPVIVIHQLSDSES